MFHVGQEAEMPVIGKLKTIFYCRMVLSVIVYCGDRQLGGKCGN